jgi:putative mRNA 3-end processing factor
MPLFTLTDAGLYCTPGDFFVDPWLPVPRAVITHGHADHARPGSASYLTARPGALVLRGRLGPEAAIESLEYGASVSMDGVRLSLHPAGHILGSAQVRVESQGEVWVISGDYKTAPDPTCAAFEPLPCHTFVTESTFGLPIYRWPAQHEVLAEINQWWRGNAEAGMPSVLFAYALGKAQRLLAGVDAAIGPIYCHGAVENVNQIYREAGIALAPTQRVPDRGKEPYRAALIVAPPSALRSPWLRRFGEYASGFVSGWMLVRGARRRRAVDRGFVLSDHADWQGLQEAIRATGAEHVLVTHGQIAPMVHWLREQGLDAQGVHTQFEGEQDEGGDEDQARLPPNH